MKRARNLSIEELIQVLEFIRAMGVTHVDAHFYDESTMSFSPTPDDDGEEEDPFPDGINFDDLIK